MKENIRVHLLVSGRVQGVLFRRYAEQKAKELEITGWVKNAIDGDVEMVCEGEKQNIKSFISWVRQGSPMAKVEKVDVEYGEYTGEWDDFHIREFGF